jgi:hypothetical protein
MIVISQTPSGTRTATRVDKTCKLVRNGSFITVEFVRDDKADWIMVDERSLKNIMENTTGHGASAMGTVCFDEYETVTKNG